MDTNDEVNNIVSKKINDNEKEKLQDSNLLGEIKKETINELNIESYEKPKQETKDELNNKPSEEASDNVPVSEEAIEEVSEEAIKETTEKPNEEENNITVDISNLDLEDFKEHETNSENIITDNLSLEEMKDEIKEEFDD